mgnify:CR=1 FL=1|tara:strand:- start:298 stop:1395 length:1098 start_codon:yes stop_codon:yes gene_type:complete
MADVTNYTIENASGANVRIDLNNVFSAIQSSNSKSTDLATSQCVAGMPFLNTTTNILKIRNSANNGFTEIGNINTANLGLLPATGGTMTGALLGHDGSTAAAPAFSFDTDTDLGLFRNAANVMGFSSGGTEQMIFSANGISLRTQNEIRFEDAGGGQYVALKAPTTVSSSFTFTLPAADGSNGQFIQTDGSGNLSFGGAGGAITLGSTSISLGSSATTIGGLTSVTSTDVNSTTLKATTIKTNASNRVAPVIQNSSGTEIAKLCKAFVNFNGQGTVAKRDDFNITSIQDLGTGFYQVNFANNMADANYTAIVTGDVRSPNNRLTSTDCNDYTASSFRISSADVTSQFGSGRADTKLVTVAVFGTT